MKTLRVLKELPQLFRYADFQKYTGNAYVFLTRAQNNGLVVTVVLLNATYLRKKVPFHDELETDRLNFKRLNEMSAVCLSTTRKLAAEIGAE